VLMWSGGCGMLRLEAAALRMAACGFEDFSRTGGFMLLGEEALSILLDDDRLVARNEEVVWEAVVGWRGGTAGKVGWRGVVGKISFPLMGEEYLRNRVVGTRMVGGEDGEWMAGVVAEALRAKAARREGVVFKLLGRKAVVDRVGLGERWEEYLEEAELLLAGHGENVSAIVACDGRICCLSWDESIWVRSRALGSMSRLFRRAQMMRMKGIV
jgi:hypothetical protein